MSPAWVLVVDGNERVLQLLERRLSQTYPVRTAPDCDRAIYALARDPFDVVGAIELSRATLRKMHQNLWWAVIYNVIAFPLAAGAFYPFTLSPEIAALSMSGSSAIVAINALMLKRTRLEGIRAPGAVQGPAAVAHAH